MRMQSPPASGMTKAVEATLNAEVHIFDTVRTGESRELKELCEATALADCLIALQQQEALLKREGNQNRDGAFLIEHGRHARQLEPVQRGEAFFDQHKGACNGRVKGCTAEGRAAW